MRKYNAIRNAVRFGKTPIKPVSEMKLITPKRNTKWLERGFIYEVVSEVDSFGYFKIKEPREIGGVVRFIHKNNMKKVKVI